MSQSIENFVAQAMDDAKLTSFHWKVITLISAGLFLDLLDIAVFGSIVPDMVRSHFATPAEIAIIVLSLFAGLFVGSIGQGEFTDRFGRKAVYQTNLLLFGVATLASAFSPNYVVFAILRFIAGIGLGAEAPLCFAYAAEFSPKRVRGRLMALNHFIGGACSWPIAILFVLLVREEIGWRGIFACIGVLALIVFILRFSLPESPRWLVTHGKYEKALDILARMKIPGPTPGQEFSTGEKTIYYRDPIAVIFKENLRSIVFAMIAFFAIYGVVYVLATWLPSMMAGRGFTITKALTFTFGMTLSFPLSSGFLMFALDRYGRRVVSVTGLLSSAILAILFWQSTSEVMLLITGFLMFFAMQTGTNAMVLYTSEIFPTNARASGMGIALGVSKISAALSGYGILLIAAYGDAIVFEVMAALLVIGAASVLLMGRETRGVALDAIAPPSGG